MGTIFVNYARLCLIIFVLGTIGSTISSLISITHVIMASNNLAGMQISSCIQCTIYVFNCAGVIPSSIGSLTNLVYLDLYSNSLHGIY